MSTNKSQLNKSLELSIISNVARIFKAFYSCIMWFSKLFWAIRILKTIREHTYQWFPQTPKQPKDNLKLKKHFKHTNQMQY